MGTKDRERKVRILSGEELAFKRKSLMRRLDEVCGDIYKEYGVDGIYYLDRLTSAMSSQVHNPEGGC